MCGLGDFFHLKSSIEDYYYRRLFAEFQEHLHSENIQISASIVATDSTRRGDALGFNEQHDTLVMIVSTDCVCHLVNIRKRQVYWLFEDEKKNLYESSRDEGVDDYLDAGVDELGRVHIYHYHPLSDNPQIGSSNLITPHVRDIYGEDVVFTTSIKNLDFQQLHIQRADYEFVMPTWRLKCSNYRASFKDSGVGCHVYHALTPEAFTTICGKFKIAQSLENMPFIHKFPGKRIRICEPKEIISGDLVKGTFEGVSVAVSVIEQANDDFSTIYSNGVWQCDGGDNVARLIGVEIQDGRCLLAFELCLTTIHEYLIHNMGGSDIIHNYGRVNTQWLDLCRGLLLGIRDLHKRSRRCHGNLNTGNILVSTRHTTKLSGLHNSRRLSDDPNLAKSSTSKDMYALGKVLLFWYSQFNFDDLTSTDNPLMHLGSINPQLSRAGYKIVKKLLGSPATRPEIDDVLSNPSFWHPNVHLEYLRELSDQLETPVGVSLLRPKIESIKSKVFPPATQQWNSEFTSTLMTEMVQKRGGGVKNTITQQLQAY